MRVGLITPGFSASEDEWCIPALLDLVRVLAASDDVTVFTLRYPHTREPYSVHGARVVPFGGAQRAGLARLPLLLRALATIVRMARRGRFDVLHALWAHEPGFLATLAGRLTGTPVVVSILGGELADLPAIEYGGERSTVNRWLTRRALRSADRVTVGSKLLERLAAGRVPPEKLCLCPLGVDTGRFSPPPEIPPRSPLFQRGEEEPPPSPDLHTPGNPPPSLPGDPALLHVASLVPVKDQGTLLRAFRIVVRQMTSARLHVVGDGPRRSELQDLARGLGIAERVTWHGAVDHGLLVGYYRAADVFVLSSLFESQGMVALEAAACGCPVVGTEVGVVPELGGVRTARPGDAEGLAAILLGAFADRQALRELAEAQRTRLPGFELEAAVERLRREYAALVRD